VHIFAHNGDLPGIEDRFPSQRHGIFSPVGGTDSEYAFCLLMQRLARIPVDIGTVATLEARKQIISTFAREIGELGPANFLYSDGDALFVHGHERSQPDGSMRAPGLYTISVSCSYGLGHSELARVELESDDVQKVTLVSTIPLTDADWKPMHKGQLLVIRGGEVIDSVPGPGYGADVCSLSPTQLVCRASSRQTSTMARLPRLRSTDSVSGLAGA
jgi:glutamine amidotransferase